MYLLLRVIFVGVTAGAGVEVHPVPWGIRVANMFVVPARREGVRQDVRNLLPVVVVGCPSARNPREG